METHFIKYLTDAEFKDIHDTIRLRASDPFRICFYFMAILGLRVSDAVRLKEVNLSSDLTSITYTDHKTHFVISKEIPDMLRKALADYIERYRHTFREGYLFPPLYNNVSSRPHLQESTFRHFFMDYRRRIALKPYYRCKNGKNLYRISPHTLKHYCLYRVYKASGNDIAFTQDFSGHREMKHTLRYIASYENKQRQRDVLNQAFEMLEV